MQMKRISLAREALPGEGPEGLFLSGDTESLLPGLLEKYAGSVQTIYLDPPFATGKKFSVRIRVGEKEWRGGSASFIQTAYDDSMNPNDYLGMMRKVLTACRALLRDTGLLFLHIDFRMNAPLRLMLDEIFGADNFLNEIVWCYKTGGRAKSHFSRKHDIILFYRKTAKYDFHPRDAALPRENGPSNHMKRHVDADGRVYRSIRSGGKVYTYYDDEPVAPSDVWDDVSHMQQKDPQRTGYDTQKPIALLDRILRCSARPGDLVMDLFAGSGTTLEAAGNLGCRFVGADKSPFAAQIIRRRLKNRALTIVAPESAGEPRVSVSGFVGVGFYHISLIGYEVEPGLSTRSFQGLDAVDSWAVGYARDGVFCEMAASYRSRKQPAPAAELRLPVYGGIIALRVSDVLGRNFYYALGEEEMER